jgi:SM-20-related protein
MFLATEIEQLGSAGWFSRPSFLGQALAQAVRAEASTVPLARAGIRRDKQLDEGVRGDEIAWLTAEEARGALGEAVQRFTGLMHALNQEAYVGLRSFDLQLAHYAPGAHYEKHLDAFPGDDNRRVTAIVYLNPAWTPADGGLLRLHVAPPVDVEPTLDRLVVFRSAVVPHEVLEAKADRWALTAWYSGR